MSLKPMHLKTLDDTDKALKNVKSSAGDAQSDLEDFNDV